MASSSSAAIGQQPRTARQSSFQPDNIQLDDLERGRTETSSSETQPNDGSWETLDQKTDFIFHYDASRVSSMPPGYEKLTNGQNLQGTWRHVRVFGTLNQRLIIWLQQRLTSGEDKLNELDKEREQALAAMAASSEPAAHAFVVQALDEKIDALGAILIQWRIQLAQISKADVMFRKYPRVAFTRHEEFYDYQQNVLGFSTEDLKYMMYPDDMVTVVADSTEALVKFINDPFDGRYLWDGLKKLLRWAFGYTDPEGKLWLRTAHLMACLPWIRAVALYALVIPLILVLYLDPMPIAARAVFVSIYFVPLTIVVAFLPLQELAMPLVCLFSFMAVPVAFLADTQAVSGVCTQ